MKTPAITQMSQEDMDLTEKIMTCGTNKTPYKKDIIYLFKKYVNSSVHICDSCSSEVATAFIKYTYHYENYKNDEGQDNG